MELKCPECSHKFETNVSVFDLQVYCPACGFGFNVGGQIKTEIWEKLPGFSKIDFRKKEPDEDVKELTRPPVVHSSISENFGDYEIISEIARGGVGVIYRARQKSLNRIVALKVLLEGEQATEEQVERLLREAKAAARLRHPNIVSIYEVGELKGIHYFTMELVEGHSIDRIIEVGQLNYKRIVSIMTQVGDAIDYAHSKGIVHRDIKPANVIVDSQNVAKVTDFGLARDIAGQNITRDGQVMGTPAYMSPEQAAGRSNEIDERSDTYSLGAILYEMLTGQPPFSADTPLGVIMKVLHDEPVPPRKLDPSIPRDLETICLKALTKSRYARYRTAKAFTEDLRRFNRGEQILARPRTWYHKTIRHLWHYRHTVAMFAILFLVPLTIWLISRSPDENLPKVTTAKNIQLSKLKHQIKNWIPLFPEIKDDEYLQYMRPVNSTGKEWIGKGPANESMGSLQFTHSVPEYLRIQLWLNPRGDAPEVFRISFTRKSGTEAPPGFSVAFRDGRIAIEKNGFEMAVSGGPRFQPGANVNITVEKLPGKISVYEGRSEQSLLSYTDPEMLDAQAAENLVISQTNMSVIVNSISMLRLFEANPNTARTALERGDYWKAVGAFKDLLTAVKNPVPREEILTSLAYSYQNLAIRAAHSAEEIDHTLNKTPLQRLELTADQLKDVMNILQMNRELKDTAFSELEIRMTGTDEKPATEHDFPQRIDSSVIPPSVKGLLTLHHRLVKLLKQVEDAQKMTSRLTAFSLKLDKTARDKSIGKITLSVTRHYKKLMQNMSDPNAAGRLNEQLLEYLATVRSDLFDKSDKRVKAQKELVSAMLHTSRSALYRQEKCINIISELTALPARGRQKAGVFFQEARKHFAEIVNLQGTTSDTALTARLRKLKAGVLSHLYTGRGEPPTPEHLSRKLSALRRDYQTSNAFFDFLMFLTSLDFEKHHLDGDGILKEVEKYTGYIEAKKKQRLVFAAISKAYCRLGKRTPLSLPKYRIRFLKQARRLSPENYQASLLLAETYLAFATRKSKRNEQIHFLNEAIENYQNVQRINPEKTGALKKAAEIKMALFRLTENFNDLNEVLKLYKAYLKAEPDDHQASLTLGKICINMGLYKQALTHLKGFLETGQLTQAQVNAFKMPTLNPVLRAQGRRLYKKAQRLYAMEMRRVVMF